MSATQAPNKPLSIPLQLQIPRTDKPQTYSLKISDPSTASTKQQSFNLSIPNITNLSSIANIGCPSPTKRIKGVTCSKSIIYGNITHQLHGIPDYSAIRPATNSNSSFDSNRNNNSYDTQEWFRWTVYVRGPQNEDLSYFIEKVVFVLHETYVHPIRVIENAPFEVTECGWGQFEVKIEIYFHSIPGLFRRRSQSPCTGSTGLLLSNSKKRKLVTPSSFGGDRKKRRKMDSLCEDKQSEIMSMFSCVDGLPNDADSDSVSSSSSFAGYDNKIVFLHSLRLFAKPGSNEDHSKKGIVEEKYATIVFNDPYYYLYQKLWMGPQKIIHNHPFYEKYWKNTIVQIAQNEQQLIDKMANCHQKLLIKIKETKKEYQQLQTK